MIGNEVVVPAILKFESLGSNTQERTAHQIEDDEMSFLLQKLESKKDVDVAIRTTEDKVLVLRFGRETDAVCLQLDDVVRQQNFRPAFDEASMTFRNFR